MAGHGVRTRYSLGLHWRILLSAHDMLNALEAERDGVVPGNAPPGWGPSQMLRQIGALIGVLNENPPLPVGPVDTDERAILLAFTIAQHRRLVELLSERLAIGDGPDRERLLQANEARLTAVTEELDTAHAELRATAPADEAINRDAVAARLAEVEHSMALLNREHKALGRTRASSGFAEGQAVQARMDEIWAQITAYSHIAAELRAQILSADTGLDLRK